VDWRVVAGFILKVGRMTRFWYVGLNGKHFPKETVLFHFGDSNVEVDETRMLDDPKCGLR
jgi:hypothetical protein